MAKRPVQERHLTGRLSIPRPVVFSGVASPLASSRPRRRRADISFQCRRRRTRLCVECPWPGDTSGGQRCRSTTHLTTLNDKTLNVQIS